MILTLRGALLLALRHGPAARRELVERVEASGMLLPFTKAHIHNVLGELRNEGLTEQREAQRKGRGRHVVQVQQLTPKGYVHAGMEYAKVVRLGRNQAPNDSEAERPAPEQYPADSSEPFGETGRSGEIER